MSAEEELSRAREYRRKMQARERDRLARETALRGSSSRLAALQEKTAPLKRDYGWNPEELVHGDAK